MVLLVVLSWSTAAWAVPHELCIKWRVESLDRTIGSRTETTAQTWNAIGVRYMASYVLPPGTIGPPPIEGNANTSGCFSFDAAANSVFNVRVYFDAKVGHQAKRRVRMFDTAAEADGQTAKSLLVTGVTPAPGSGGVERATVTAGTGANDYTISMAAATYTLHRVDLALDSSTRPSGNMDLRMIKQDCDGPPPNTDTGSCYGAPYRLWLDPGNGSTHRKYVVSHEVGHYLDHRWGATAPTTFATLGDASADYSFTDSQMPEQCQWTMQGAHAMRSQEFQTGALREGFAHFWAAYSFNDLLPTSSASFGYYKSGGMTYNNETYSVSSAGSYPLMYLQDAMGCNCGALGTCLETSTQLQWMRAYWRYTIQTVASYPVPTLAQFFAQVRAGPASDCGNNNRCHKAMRDAAATTALRNRWDSVSETMGLQTDAP